MNQDAMNHGTAGLIDIENKVCPLGTKDAVIVQIVDLGTKTGEWGEQYWMKYVFEVQDKNDPDEPFLITTNLTLSLAPKSNLRKMLVKIRNRDFTEEEIDTYKKDLSVLFKKMLGVGCMISVIENKGKNKKGEDKVYHNVADVFNLDRDKWFEPKTEKVFFGIESDFPTNQENQGSLRKLPDWVQKIALEKNATLDKIYNTNRLFKPTFDEWQQGYTVSQSNQQTQPKPQSNTTPEPVVNDNIPF
jgi:hypothetical protein